MKLREQLKTLNPEQIITLRSRIYNENIWIGKVKFVKTNFSSEGLDSEEYDIIPKGRR